MAKRPFMTKKHYEFIARIFKDLIETESLDDPHPSDVVEIATCFADALEDTNPLFNRDLFLFNCGVNVGTNNTSSSD